MAQAPNTNSTLSFPGGQNKTSTAISTNIIITVRNSNGVNIPVGAVQSMAIDETRSIKMIDEVGTDGHIDSVPNQSTNIKGTCQRVRFDRLRVAEAFSRGFVHVASQAYPFDIVIFDKQKLATGLQISTVIKNVWIAGISYTYQVSDWVITDNMTWEAETYLLYPQQWFLHSGGSRWRTWTCFQQHPNRTSDRYWHQWSSWFSGRSRSYRLGLRSLQPTRHCHFLIFLISQYTP